MKSRFYYVMHRATDLSATLAEEGVEQVILANPISTDGEYVAALPRVANKLNDIETLYYAGASEALNAALDDLERYIKLLAMGSYKNIAMTATESATAEMMTNTYDTIINYSLRLIEGINSPEADEVRECLEGYLEMFESDVTLASFEVTNDALSSIDEVLGTVLESALNNEYDESGFDIEEPEIISVESVINQAMGEIGSNDDFVPVVDILNEMVEDLYIEACEQLIVLEGAKYTSFDKAMEAPLDSSYYTEKNRQDEEKEKAKTSKAALNALKKSAQEYLSKLEDQSSDLDIGRSRNNNVVMSGRHNKKLKKLRAGKNLDGAIDTLRDILTKAESLDPKNPEDRNIIDTLDGKITAVYNQASKMGKDALKEETDFVEGRRLRQVERAKSGGIIEKGMRQLSKTALGLKNKIDESHQKKYRKDMHSIEEDYRAGKMTREERDDKLAAREEKFINKKKKSLVNKAIDKTREVLNKKTDTMKAARDEIVKNDGVYYRDKDLVEKDIQEAFKKKVKTPKKTKDKDAESEKEEKPIKTTDSDKKTTSVSFEDPDTASRVENFKSFTPAARKQLFDFKNKYRDLYEKFNAMKEDDPDYDKVKTQTKSALDDLKTTAHGLDVTFGKKTDTSKTEGDEHKPPKPPKDKPRVAITDHMSPEEKKEYSDLRRDMTEALQAVNKYKDDCRKKGDTPDSTVLNSLQGAHKRARKKFNDFESKFKGTEALAELLYADINLVEYAIESGFSIYDMAKMSESALESFMIDIADLAYDDCIAAATVALEGKETKEEKKARKEAEQLEKEEALKAERSDARQKVIDYANDKIAKIDDLQKTIGTKWHTYSNDVKNLSERGTDGKLRGLKNIRERRIVKKSVGGAKFDFKKYNQLLKDLKKTKKELNDFISTKKFYDEYDSTDNPEKDYKAAIKEINKMIGNLINNATESRDQIKKLGKVLDNNPTVLHERDDKEAWRKKQAEEARKKDKKNNPDKYKLLDSEKIHDEYQKQRAKLDSDQAALYAGMAGMGTAQESMELPEVVDSIDDFDSTIDCMLFDLRDTLVDPECFFDSSGVLPE